MLDSLLDALLDTIKLIPYLFVAFLILEFIEHKFGSKSQKFLIKYRKSGPIIGALFGAFPECGFSAISANLFSSHLITLGTLVAIFLSTSDEMLPIMLGSSVPVSQILSIILLKIIIGIFVGIIVDIFYKTKIKSSEISEMCSHEHCHCGENIFLSALIHTLKTSLFILIANLIINILIFVIGSETLASFLGEKSIFSYFVSALIGLIPNCASSVILTEVYLSGFAPLGVVLSGLLAGSGVGILLLFKTNKNTKQNLLILPIVYLSGVIFGILTDLFIPFIN